MKWLRDRGDLVSAIVTFVAVVLLWWQGVVFASFAQRAWAAHVQATKGSPSGTGATTTSKPHVSFGDTYTAIGALFAGLAFAAVAWTLFRQHQQMNQARLREQFFQLLNAWQSASRDIRYNGKQGNDRFLRAENDLLGAYDGNNAKFCNRGQLLGKARDQQEGPLPVDQIVKTYRQFYEHYVGGSLVYIFRLQYQILKTIHSSGLPQAMRRDLAAIYRSMLSDPELHLLLYFSLSSYAPKDYCELISQYELLDSLLFKEERFIADRIPEIQHFRLYGDWRNRRRQLMDSTIPP